LLRITITVEVVCFAERPPVELGPDALCLFSVAIVIAFGKRIRVLISLLLADCPRIVQEPSLCSDFSAVVPLYLHRFLTLPASVWRLLAKAN
jgi:hypothetical protein